MSSSSNSLPSSNSISSKIPFGIDDDFIQEVPKSLEINIAEFFSGVQSSSPSSSSQSSPFGKILPATYKVEVFCVPIAIAEYCPPPTSVSSQVSPPSLEIKTPESELLVASV